MILHQKYKISQVGGASRPIFALVPNLQIGNPEGEALASRDRKLELPIPHSQAGAWELANPRPASVFVSSHRFYFYSGGHYYPRITKARKTA